MTEERIWRGVKYDGVGVRGVVCDRLPQEGRDKRIRQRRRANIIISDVKSSLKLFSFHILKKRVN